MFLRFVADSLDPDFKTRRLRSTVGVLPTEEQLAWEPEPEVNVEVVELAMEVFVSEERVRVRANFSGTWGTQGDMGGEEMREENTESQESLSSCNICRGVATREVRGGLAGGMVLRASIRRWATEGAMCRAPLLLFV